MSKVINKFLHFFEVCLIVIISITIFVMVYNFFQLKVLKNDYINIFGYSVFEVVSDSMAPSIRKKDVIVVKLDKEIKKNDIVTYKKDDAFITHRVVDIKDEYLITRGDSNNSKDIPILRESAIGTVIKIIPNLGIWRDILITPKVLISIIVTLILFNIVLTKGSNNKRKNKGDDFSINYNNIIEESIGKFND